MKYFNQIIEKNVVFINLRLNNSLPGLQMLLFKSLHLRFSTLYASNA